MKKVLTLLGVTIVASLSFNNTAVAQVQQGNVIIDPYVGLPTRNIIWGILEDGSSDSDGYNTVGPPISFGGRVEFMAADNFGIGVDVNYVISGFQYNVDDYYDEVTDETYDANYKYNANILRAMLRLNYHFVQTSEVDAYFGVGAGYRNVKRSVSYEFDGVEREDATNVTLIPVAFRLAFGGRYYFTDNIGANFELGLLGGSPIQVGVSIKL